MFKYVNSVLVAGVALIRNFVVLQLLATEAVLKRDAIVVPATRAVLSRMLCISIRYVPIIIEVVCLSSILRVWGVLAFKLIGGFMSLKVYSSISKGLYCLFTSVKVCDTEFVQMTVSIAPVTHSGVFATFTCVVVFVLSILLIIVRFLKL
mgnify:CR=1 FL=1